MSGPKISIYDLSPEARKNLREQLKCDRQSLTCIRQAETVLRELMDKHVQIGDALAALKVLQARTGGCAELIAELEALDACLSEDVGVMRAQLRENRPQTGSKYNVTELTEEVLAAKRAKLEAVEAVRESALALEKRFGDVLERAEAQNAEESQALRDDIARDVGSVVSFEVERPSEAQLLARAKQEQREKLTALAAESPDAMKPEIMNAVAALGRITSGENLRTFEALTILPLQKRCEEEAGRIAARRAEYAELQARYEALCSLIGTEARKLPCTDEGVALLKREIDSLEQALVRQSEQEYISACVDEVMAEMGYDLIGARKVTKRSGRRFRNELYTFEEGTAVNVTYSSDGQISMELGGIAREDRIPTAAETAALCEDMEIFCGDFAEIERRLQAKGVLLGRRIGMAPPSAEYAAIINVSDYDVEPGKQVAELHVSGKRRRIASRRTMKRGEN